MVLNRPSTSGGASWKTSVSSEGFLTPTFVSFASRSRRASEYSGQCSRIRPKVLFSGHLRHAGLSTADIFERKARVKALLQRSRRRSVAFFRFRPRVRHSWCAANVAGAKSCVCHLTARRGPGMNVQSPITLLNIYFMRAMATRSKRKIIRSKNFEGGCFLPVFSDVLPTT